MHTSAHLHTHSSFASNAAAFDKESLPPASPRHYTHLGNSRLRTLQTRTAGYDHTLLKKRYHTWVLPVLVLHE